MEMVWFQRDAVLLDVRRHVLCMTSGVDSEFPPEGCKVRFPFVGEGPHFEPLTFHGMFFRGDHEFPLRLNEVRAIEVIIPDMVGYLLATFCLGRGLPDLDWEEYVVATSYNASRSHALRPWQERLLDFGSDYPARLAEFMAAVKAVFEESEHVAGQFDPYLPRS